ESITRISLFTCFKESSQQSASATVLIIITSRMIARTLAGLKHCRLHNHSSLLSPPSLSLSIQAPAQDLQPLLEPTQLPPLEGRLTISTGRISFFLTLPFGDAQETCQQR